MKRLFLLAFALVVSVASAAELRGMEAAALAVAVQSFKKIYAKPDLRHYSVRYVRHGSELEVTFVGDTPSSYGPGKAGTGGDTQWGPDMTYVVSLKTLKIIRFNFYR